jgi:hypothetical protein
MLLVPSSNGEDRQLLPRFCSLVPILLNASERRQQRQVSQYCLAHLVVLLGYRRNRCPSSH